MKKFLLLLIITIACLTNADEVQTKDGSTLKGVITTIKDGKLTIKTAYAGDIVIDLANITSYSTDSIVNVKDKDEQLVRKKITSDDGGNIKTLWSEGEDPDIFQNKWKRRAWLDLRNTNGNTDTKRLNIGLEVSWIREFSTLKLYGEYTDEENNDVQVKEEWLAGIDYEQRFKENKSFYYLRAEYENDRINDIKLSQTYIAGYGYYFIEEADTLLRGRAGIQYNTTDYYEDDTDDSIGIDVEVNFKTKIYESLSWYTDIIYRPTFDEPLDDYRIRHESGFSVPLATSWNTFFKTGVIHRYKSQPAEGTKKLDTEYFMRIEVIF